MTNAVLYQLFLSVWIVMMYALHRNAKPGASSRWLWLAGPIVSALPFLIPSGTILINQSFTLPDVVANVTQVAGDRVIDWVLLIYGLGTVLACCVISYRMALVFQMRRQSKLIHDKGNAWLELPEDKAKYGAFSFFNWIFLPGNIDAELRDCMHLHEKVHVSKMHSLDVLYVQIIKVVFWFNPIILLMQAGLKDCHEYEADFETSSQVGAGRYANALVSSSFGLKAIMPIVHPFGSVRNIKTRINMLHSSKSPRFTWLWMVALSAAFISFQACSKSADSKKGSSDTESMVTERNAEFPGGVNAMVAFVADNMNYPEEAKESGIEGKTYVEFIISDDGTAGNATIKKSLSPELDAAALAIIKCRNGRLP
jgi:hypothetical protein